MARASRALVVLTAFASLVASGCNTPESVSKFCAASNATLTAAIPVFQDIPASCLRKKNLELPIGSFSTVADNPECDKLGTASDGAVAGVKLLAKYFTALNSLATFGSADTNSDLMTLVSKTEAALQTPENADARTAVSSIAGFISKAATGAYQQHALVKDLENASADIPKVTDALVRILQEDYLARNLNTEEEKLTARYSKFSQRNTGGDVTLLLDQRWHTDEQAIAAKQAAAADLIDSLNTIGKGSAELAKKGRTLKAKQLPALLDPYVTQLQTLVPQILKAY